MQQQKNIRLQAVFLLTACIIILFSGTAQAGIHEPDSLLLQLEQNPCRLRQLKVRNALPFLEAESYGPLLRTIMLDSSLSWDIRAHAYVMLGNDRSDMDIRSFKSVFTPVVVAADKEGAETFNILARWYREASPSPTAVNSLIFPGTEMAGVNPVLLALGGKEIHEYLWALYLNGYHFQPAAIEALAETDDQPTRQFLNWYVGSVQLDSMQGFLVDQLKSSRPNNYPDQVGGIILGALTLFLYDIFDLYEDPPWLAENVTPKNMALQSLAVFVPPGRKINDRYLVQELLEEAKYNAAGKDRSQWQLAIDIMDFLLERHELYPGRGEHILNRMVRQALTRCGPFEPFAAAERIHHLSGITFPPLSPEEKENVWDITFTTFDGEFLAAVLRTLPDAKREGALTRHLLSLQDQAVKGSLRITRRCWGAPFEDNKDWALAAGEIGLFETIPSLEKMLYRYKDEETVTALIKMKNRGASVLERFLRSADAKALHKPAQLVAIRACKEYLPEAEWNSLATYLRSQKHFSAIMAQEF